MNKYFSLILLLMLLFTACKQDEIPTKPLDWKYTGMTQGVSKIFEVKEISYFIGADNYTIIGDTDIVYFCNSGACVLDTVVYFVKEVVDRKIIDQEGDSVFIIERYYSDIKDWSETPDSVWTSKYENNQYLRTENNQKYAKLTFPISIDTKWDYNIHNGIESDETTYSAIRTTTEIDGVTFDDVIIVEKEYNSSDKDDSILNDFLAEDYIVQREFYAAGIGLIYKEDINLNNCQDNGNFCSNDIFVIAEGKCKIEKLIN